MSEIWLRGPSTVPDVFQRAEREFLASRLGPKFSTFMRNVRDMREMREMSSETEMREMRGER